MLYVVLWYVYVCGRYCAMCYIYVVCVVCGVLCVCVCWVCVVYGVCVLCACVHAHAKVHICRSEDDLQKLVLILHHAGPRLN